MDPEEGTGSTGFETANEVVETDPFVLGVSVTLIILTEAGIRGGRVLVFCLLFCLFSIYVCCFYFFVFVLFCYCFYYFNIQKIIKK